MTNQMKLEFLSKSSNESFARATVAAFVSQLDPTLSELADIKTAVSEAVTNAIIHGYGHDHGIVTITCTLDGDCTIITIADSGAGIRDVELARTPLYTSCPEMERSGMGFTVMETFMDRLEVQSEQGTGTTVTLTKYIRRDTEQPVCGGQEPDAC